VGRATFYWPPRFGVDPRRSETTTGEDERMQPVFIHDRKVQIAIGRNFVNGANKGPVPSENYIRTYSWCSPAKMGLATMAPD
jgi:hypothetical protein